MNIEINPLKLLNGASFKSISVISDQNIGTQREVCLQITLICNDQDVPQKPKVKLSDYVMDWLLKVNYRCVKGSTLDRKEQTAKNQVIPLLGEKAITEITLDDVQGMLDELTDMGYSYSTIKKAHDLLSEMYDYAIIHKDAFHKPTIGSVLPENLEHQQRDIHYYTESEYARLVEESYHLYQSKQSERNAPLIPFLLNTGLRIGEALALHWSDIDFEHAFVRVRKNVKEVKNRSGNENEPHYIVIEQSTLKTASSDRVVHLNADALKALSALPPHKKENELLFRSEKDKRCTYSSLHRMLERICNRAEVKPLGFHAFRHTFATRLFAKGVEVKTVSSILGHASVTITYNIYIHSIQEQEARAVALLAE